MKYIRYKVSEKDKLGKKMLSWLGFGEKGTPYAPVNGGRIFLRPPIAADSAAWVALRNANRDFHAPVSPLATLKDLTPDGFRRRLAAYRAEWVDDRGYTFLIFLQGSGKMIGGITANNIVRGAGQMATLGYWLDQPHTRQGYMSEAVNLCADFCFHTLRLHRLQASCLPDNAASIGVLKKCGFEHEGIAKKYIRIAGAWQDHLIFARIAPEI